MAFNDIKTVHLDGEVDSPSPAEAVFTQSEGGSPKMTRKKLTVVSEDESSTDSESTTETSESSSSASSSSSDSESESSSDSASTVDTLELLGSDPLFLVLSQFFMTGEKQGGKNITEVLQDISDKLSSILELSKKKTHRR